MSNGKYLDNIFGRNLTPLVLTDIGQCKEALQTCLCETLATYTVLEPQETPKTAKLATISIYGVSQGH